MAVKRILIIDDARDIGRMYQQALRTAYPRLQVIYVPSAEEAIVEAITYTVDLMVVDIRLPGMSGFDLVRRVRLRQPDVKVIMITGMRLEGEVERQSKEVNAALLLRKPVSIADFLEAVKKTIGDETAEVAAEGKGSQKARDKTAPIHRPVETPAVPQADPAPEPSLSESLAGLRGSLGALAVLLLDDTGRVTAQAGDWPSSDLAATLVPDLMAGMSAAHKVSRQIGAPIPDAVQALRGKDYDLLAAPVGRYALLIFLKRGPGALRMALAFEEALLAQKQFARYLSELGLNISPILSQPERPPEQAGVGEVVQAAPQPNVADNEMAEPPAAALQALEEMLASPPAGPSTQDAEAFWDNAEGDETPVPANADVLTYEQAMKLGLFPEEH